MSQVITATFENGVLKPSEPLNLRPHTWVRLTAEPLAEETQDAERRQAWEELEQLWQSPLESGGERLSREQLHERR